METLNKNIAAKCHIYISRCLRLPPGLSVTNINEQLKHNVKNEPQKYKPVQFDHHLQYFFHFRFYTKQI